MMVIDMCVRMMFQDTAIFSFFYYGGEKNKSKG